MADIKLKVTRDQLYKIFKDHELVKQFERLFDYMNSLVPGDSTNTSITAFTAEARTNELINEIHELKKEIAEIKQQPVYQNNQIYELKKEIEEIKQFPSLDNGLFELEKRVDSLEQNP